MRVLVLLLLTSCGLHVRNIDARLVREGADAAIAEDGRAQPIVDNLEVMGHPVADMRRICRRLDLSKVEGCAFHRGTWPYPSRIAVANDVDDIAAITKHEVLNLVFWDEGYDQ